MDILKPCPFCTDGGKPGLAYRAVKCYECGVRVDGDTDMEAIEKWNRRYKWTCNMEKVENAGATSFLCSECGKLTWNYLYPRCPSCGAEVA